MIVVDSSALIAILEKEDDAARYAAAIEQAERLLISAMNAHETGMVLRVRRGSAAVTRMWRFLQQDMISRSCRLTKLKYGKHSTPSPALEIKSVRSSAPIAEASPTYLRAYLSPPIPRTIASSQDDGAETLNGLRADPGAVPGASTLAA